MASRTEKCSFWNSELSGISSGFNYFFFKLFDFSTVISYFLTLTDLGEVSSFEYTFVEVKLSLVDSPINYE